MARGKSRQASNIPDRAVEPFSSEPGSKERYQRLNDYDLALGRFVDAFSQTENFMHYVLRWYTQTPSPIAKAIFSGTRIEVNRGFLRRLRDVGHINDDDWNSLEHTLDQLKIINDKRNDILHYGARDIADGEAYVTNALMALTQERVSSFPISPRILRDMTADLRSIMILLLVRHMGLPTPEPLRVQAQETQRSAWRYKPPQRSQNHSRPANKTPKRGHQRSPSRE
jgi:hypothetical protein